MKSKSKLNNKPSVLLWIVFAVLLVYALMIITLLLWGVVNSVKSPNEFRFSKIWFPKEGFAFDNYVTVWQDFSVRPKGTQLEIGLLQMIINTLLYTFGSAFVMTACYCIMSYITAKYKYVFSKIVYSVVVITMVVPIIGSAPATMDFLSKTHLLDTWVGNYIMKFNFLGMYFLVFYSMFKSLPNEFYEAAIIDGANEWQVFLRIMFPLVIPTFGTIFLIKFIEFWNDYQTPLLYLNTHPTLAYGVQSMATSGARGMSRVPMKLASCMIMMLPILFMFIFLRNKIMGNVTMGGVKE